MISMDCEACTTRLGSNLGRSLKVLLSLRRSVKFTTSWSVPVEVVRNNWLSNRGLIIVPFRPRTTGYVGKAENDGSRQRAEHTAYEEERGDVPSSEVSRKRVRADKREGINRTVYELLFGRLCADANGIGEEVSLVPADLDDGL